MKPPDPLIVAHDLRNILGVVHAMAADLKISHSLEPREMPERLAELESHTDFTMEALRVVEQQANDAPMLVHLGAWGWALRLWVRSLIIGDLAAAPKTRIALAPALVTGIAMLRAMHPTRPVNVEASRTGLRFTTDVSAHDIRALEQAIERLAQSGLAAKIIRESPCELEITAAG